MDGLRANDLEDKTGLTDFCFTDIMVTRVKKKHWKGEINHENCHLIPFPKSLDGCDNIDTLFAWNLWYHLTLIARKKLRMTRQRMKRKNRKNYARPSIDEPIAVFSYSRSAKMFTLTIQPWAAELLKLPPNSTYPSPPNCPLDVYTEVVAKINGGG